LGFIRLGISEIPILGYNRVFVCVVFIYFRFVYFRFVIVTVYALRVVSLVCIVSSPLL